MKVDFKVETWERYEVPEEHSEKVLKAIKEGKINDSGDLFNFLDEMGEPCNQGHLDIAPEQITVQENGGFPTLECYEGEEKVWDNQIG